MRSKKRLVVVVVFAVLAVITIFVWQAHQNKQASIRKANEVAKKRVWKKYKLPGSKFHLSHPGDWKAQDYISRNTGPTHKTILITSPGGKTTVVIDDGFTSESIHSADFPILLAEPIKILGKSYYLAYILGIAEHGSQKVYASIITDPKNAASLPESPDLPAQNGQPTYIEIGFTISNSGTTVSSIKRHPEFEIAKRILQSMRQ